MENDFIDVSLKQLPATQYDIALVRKSLHDIRDLYSVINNKLDMMLNVDKVKDDSRLERCIINETHLENFESATDRKLLSIETKIEHRLNGIEKDLSKEKNFKFMLIGALIILEVLAKMFIPML